MSQHPVNLKINYPETSDKLTALFRLILVIPIIVIIALITQHEGAFALAVTLMLLFQQKYPRWWFDWSVAITKFSYRIAAYGLLMRDEYPSTDSEQEVLIDIPFPDAEKDLNKWMPLIKWILVIPHIIVLCFVFIGVIIGTVVAWFSILFTGKYPKGIFDFVEGFLRWSLRVNAYALILSTDKYPPFSLRE